MRAISSLFVLLLLLSGCVTGNNLKPSQAKTMCEFRGEGFCVNFGDGLDASIYVTYGHNFRSYEFRKIGDVASRNDIELALISVGNGMHVTQDLWSGHDFKPYLIDGERVQLREVEQEQEMHRLIKRDLRNVTDATWQYTYIITPAKNSFAENVFFNNLRLCRQDKANQHC